MTAIMQQPDSLLAAFAIKYYANCCRALLYMSSTTLNFLNALTAALCCQVLDRCHYCCLLG